MQRKSKSDLPSQLRCLSKDPSPLEAHLPPSWQNFTPHQDFDQVPRSRAFALHTIPVCVGVLLALIYGLAGLHVFMLLLLWPGICFSVVLVVVVARQAGIRNWQTYATNVFNTAVPAEIEVGLMGSKGRAKWLIICSGEGAVDSSAMVSCSDGTFFIDYKYFKTVQLYPVLVASVIENLPLSRRITAIVRSDHIGTLVIETKGNRYWCLREDLDPGDHRFSQRTS